MMTRSRTKLEAKKEEEEGIGRKERKRQPEKEEGSRRKGKKKGLENERCLPMQEEGTELIPEIPNDITLQVISTMLPWETIRILSSVSHAWQEAIQSGEIYDARVKTQSTETLIVINHTSRSVQTNQIFLCSPRNKACISLPPIPHVLGGYLIDCRCLTLDGKIYILGGFTVIVPYRCSPCAPPYEHNQEVYVLDIARQSQWRKCARMPQWRYRFGCGVMDGKIYVIGGESHSTASNNEICESEVYDPKTDTWGSIASMTSCRLNHHVGIVGDELLAYGGSFRRGRGRRQVIGQATHFEVYNPVQDRWRKLPQGPGADLVDETKELLFMAEGKLHSTTGSAIFVYDLENNMRTLLHSCYSSDSFAAKRISSWRHNPPQAIVAVEGQLLALVLNKRISKGLPRRVTLCIGTPEGAKCVWREADCSHEFDSGYFSAVTIRL